MLYFLSLIPFTPDDIRIHECGALACLFVENMLDQLNESILFASEEEEAIHGVPKLIGVDRESIADEEVCFISKLKGGNKYNPYMPAA